MTTKNGIKRMIETALEKLHGAENDLQAAMGLMGDTGNRIDLAAVQASLKLAINKTEDLIYPREDETLEVFAIVDGDGNVVGKYSEVNNI